MGISLTIVFSENPMVQPLKDGTVRPSNIDLTFVTVDHPGDLFYRNLKHDEFDVSEMGIPWTIRAMEINSPERWDWAKLPIFLSRGTGWAHLYVNTASGINGLQDLRGKRICVPEYNTSMCLWLRAMMNDFYGIRSEDNVWYVARGKERSQGRALGIEEDRPDAIEVVWLTDEQTPDGMLDKGEVDAAIIHAGSFGPDSIDRYSGASLKGNPRIRKLFPDEGRRLIREFVETAGVYQINHHVIVQNRILRRHPWAAMELFTAFQRSKDVALARMPEQKRRNVCFDHDDYPLGIKAMRKSFDRYIQEMVNGGLISQWFQTEEVYYPTTLET